MIFDLNELGADELPDYDVCIIGSGPAGGTVAAELAGSGLRVCVLESGRRQPTRQADELKAVQSAGIPIKDWSRERVLGGASTTWAGLSSPLDRADLGPRPFLRHSGWPLAHAELLELYAEAAARYGFPPLAFFEPGGFAALRGQGGVAPTWSELDEKIFLAAEEPQNFARLVAHVYEGPVDLYLDASVAALVCADGEGRVRAARAISRGGRAFEVGARAFVVACGGIENARLLLNSRDGLARPLGNAHDQVGRYFMNHPKNYRGILHLARPAEDVPYYFGCLYRGYAGYAGLRLAEEQQARRGLLNSYVRFEPLFPWSDSRGVEALVLFAKKSAFVLQSFKRRQRGELVTLRDYAETGDDSELQNARKSALGWLGLCAAILFDLPRVLRYLWYRLVARAKPKIARVRLRNFMEMEPDPDNRVVLADAVDRHGQPLPKVEHRCTELDRRSLIELHRALAREFERTGLGRLESDLERAEPWPITEDASHHVGTTRMGSDPRSSVTDPDAKVHGVANLYMAGASLFPTSGCANPTFTIVALSIRLARHLRRAVFGLAS